jgi:hypothetical protein
LGKWLQRQYDDPQAETLTGVAGFDAGVTKPFFGF